MLGQECEAEVRTALLDAERGTVPSNNPVVSIVTIFLNAEEFIEEAVESAFTQTYAQWELLLVDDGSTDGSSEIARRYTARNPERVRYLEHAEHANRGMSASRNLGARNARGKYVAFLDADDVWLPQKLEEQVALLNGQPEAAMVYGLSEFWYSWAGDHKEGNDDFLHDLGVPSGTLIQPPTLINHFFFAQDAAIPGPTDVLVRREAIEQVGGFVDEFRGAYEDEVFYAKICLNVPVLAVDTCWDRYRQHPGSSNSVVERAGEEYATRVVFLTWLESYLAEQGVKDSQMLRALRKELWRCRHPRFSEAWKGRSQLISNIVRRVLPQPVRHWLRAELKGTNTNV
jgi:glycosyltransferase involved in cell wall biosynthesis